MLSSPRRAAGLRVAAASALIALLSLQTPAAVVQHSDARPLASSHAKTSGEVRALWVLRSSLTTPANIQTLVRTASAQGFNTLLVQIRGRGDAYYVSTLEPRAAELVRQPATFDPLATVIREAHAAGLRVHAWMNTDLVSSAVDLPLARNHIIYQHPEWLMVPREIAQDVAKLDPTNPGYVGKIARWSRAESEAVEGLYSSPINPAAAEHTFAVVTDVANRYDLDGIHLDYVRYPNDQFDYSRFAIAAFRASIRPRLAAAVRAAVDAQDAIDLFAYPDRFPTEWKEFRRDRLTSMVTHIAQTLRAEHPKMMLTMAVKPDAAEAADVRLQDWRRWLQTGLVDAVCPMAYTQEADKFVEQIAAARDAAGDRAIWAGIGAYRLTPAQTIENIQAARRLGAAGFVLFSYDSLTGPKPPAPDYLATVSRAAFSSSTDEPRDPGAIRSPLFTPFLDRRQ
jgi:uncharacterized lipoprotein YddW (UPF0748 family)